MHAIHPVAIQNIKNAIHGHKTTTNSTEMI